MRIALIGGHGKVARHLTPLLVAAGHEVTSIIRNPGHAAELEALGATPVVADIERLDTDAFTRVIAGHDAVVWSAGAGGGDPQRTLAVDRDAAIRSFEASERAGVRRYVMVSYFGASLDHGVQEGEPFYAYAEAKARADEALRATALDWTILGPSALTDDDATGHIDATAEKATSVSRADVARVVAATLADETTVRRSIRFNAGETPIADAIAS